MKKSMLRLAFMLFMVAMSSLIIAVSCNNKTAANNGNSTDNSGEVVIDTDDGAGTNSGTDMNGGTDTSKKDDSSLNLYPSTDLILTDEDLEGNAYVKISGDTVTINANELAKAIAPNSDSADSGRGYDDASGAESVFLFSLKYPGATSAMILVNRAHVTKDAISLPSARGAICSSSESGDNALADTAGGGHCRIYTAGANAMEIYSYLGTVFNNTKNETHARGIMRCDTRLREFDSKNYLSKILSDTVIFNQLNRSDCSFAMVNNGLGRGVEINDAWVNNSGSTTEVEFYAIGIDLSDKTIPQFSDAPGYGLAEFIKEHDNTATKNLLKKNKWGDLRFKVKIITSTDFAALP